MSQDKQQTNPFSSGDGGGTFETRVEAAFAALMLAGGEAPCLPSWPISKIKMQGKYAGFNTDDCIVFTQDYQTKKEYKLLAQIKHSINITEKDQMFSDVILSAWNDFNNPEVFTEGSDAIALITGPLSSTDIDSVRPLLEWARHCADANEFYLKVKTAKFSSDTKRKKLNVFRVHLKSANGGVDVSDEMFWRFLKSYYLIGYDLDTATGSTLALLHALIGQSSKEHQPDVIWAQINTAIQNAKQNAGTLTLDTVPETLRSCFDASLTQHWNTDLQKLNEHSRYILCGIRADVAGVHINRQDVFLQLLDLSETSNFVLLSGGRGCGKSGIVREFSQFVENRYPVFCFRTEDFCESHLDKVFSAMGLQSSLDDLASGFAMMSKKYLLVESLEKLLELQNRDAFTDLLQFIKNKPGWTVIASGRDYAYQQITMHYLQPHGISWSSLTVPEFSAAETETLCSTVDALKPLAGNVSIKKLIKNPFFAELAARVGAAGTRFTEDDGEEAFRAAVWRDVISKEQERTNGMPLKRKKAFIDIAVKRAKLMQYGISESEYDSEALLKLEEDHLIQRDLAKGLVSPAHDVLEDWALEIYIEEAFQRNTLNVSEFFDAVGSEPAINRAFRLWLHHKLRIESAKEETIAFVLSVIGNKELQAHWKDEAITAILLGDNLSQFLVFLRDRLFENKAEMLKRFCFILRLSCKAPDHELIRQLTGSDEKLAKSMEPAILRPYGVSWEELIKFLYVNRASLAEELLPHITAVLDEWANVIHIEKELPQESREAGLLVLHMLDIIKDSYRKEENTKKLLGVIIKTVHIIQTEFSDFLSRDIFIHDERRSPGYVRQFLPMALVSYHTIPLCKYVPDLVIKLALHEWLLPERSGDRSWDSHPDVEDSFGLHRHRNGAEFFPASGLKGPFTFLLRYHARKGLDFIIDLCNRTAEKYAQSTLDSKDKERYFVAGFTEGVFTVELPLTDGTTIKQFCSHRLWSGYRGSAVLPYLLQSALMALENWLISMAERSKKADSLEWIIDHILKNSNSVMTTAVIASVAVGFPEKLGKAALPLLRTPDLYHWDLIRYTHEAHALGAGYSHDPMWKVYAEERNTSNSRPWRKEHLETLAIRLQMTDLRDEIFAIIDTFRTNIPKSEYEADSEKSWRFRLHRMDTRGWEPVEDKENNRVLFTPKALEPDLKEIQSKSEEVQQLNNRFMSLFLWSEGIFKKEKPNREYYASWREALQEAKSLHELIKSGEVSELARLQSGGIVTSAAVIIRDHGKELAEEDSAWCAVLIVETVLSIPDSDETSEVSARSGFSSLPAAVQVLPIIFDFADGEEEDQKLIKDMIALALTHSDGSVRMAIAQGIQQNLWQRKPAFAQHCLEGALEFAKLRMSEVHCRRNRLRQSGVDQRSSEFEAAKAWRLKLREQIVGGEINADPNQISFNTHSSWHLLAPYLMIPTGSTSPSHIAFSRTMLEALLAVEQINSRAQYREDERINMPDRLASDFTQRFSEHLVNFSAEEVKSFVELIIKHIESAPHFLDWFLLCFHHLAETQGSTEQYWRVWSMLSEKVVEISLKLNEEERRDIYSDDRGKVISRMLFNNIPWQKVKSEYAFLVQGKKHIYGLVEKAGTNILVFEGMSRLMFYFPDLFLLDGLFLLAKHQENINGTRLFGVNTVFYMERVLQQLLIVNPIELRKSSKLRDASRVLLNAMIETGSSCAYFLREHLIHSNV